MNLIAALFTLSLAQEDCTGTSAVDWKRFHIGGSALADKYDDGLTEAI